MITISFTIGETKTWSVRLRDAGGMSPDLSGVNPQLRVSRPDGTCQVIQGDAHADVAGAISFRLNGGTIDLPAGRHNASLWVQWPGGDEICYARVRLLIEEGC